MAKRTPNPVHRGGSFGSIQRRRLRHRYRRLQYSWLVVVIDRGATPECPVCRGRGLRRVASLAEVEDGVVLQLPEYEPAVCPHCHGLPLH